jgi:hypothetical protein
VANASALAPHSPDTPRPHVNATRSIRGRSNERIALAFSTEMRARTTFNSPCSLRLARFAKTAVAIGCESRALGRAARTVSTAWPPLSDRGNARRTRPVRRG